jgi:tRNA(His) 5'-end guanylyltransferase
MKHAVYETLYSKYGKQTDQLLADKNIEERKKIIEDAGINFNSYPTSFRHGVSTYLVPQLSDTQHGQITKHKWIVDFETPLFSDDKTRLTTILNTGSDIFRPERDLT